MAAVELSDLVGAMELCLRRHHPAMMLEDPHTISRIPQRVFESGIRS